MIEDDAWVLLRSHVGTFFKNLSNVYSINWKTYSNKSETFMYVCIYVVFIYIYNNVCVYTYIKH